MTEYFRMKCQTNRNEIIFQFRNDVFAMYKRVFNAHQYLYEIIFSFNMFNMFLPLTCARAAKNIGITQFNEIIFLKNNFMVNDCKPLFLLFSSNNWVHNGNFRGLGAFWFFFSSSIIQVVFTFSPNFVSYIIDMVN